jgi:hypothetical protein
MKLLCLLPLTLLATPAIATEPAAKRAVDVRANATDTATEAFVAAVRTAAGKGERVRVQTAEEDDDLALIVSNVAKNDDKLTWSVDLLKVNTGFTPSRLGAFEGKCRESKLAECAGGVIADADRAVRKADKD